MTKTVQNPASGQPTDPALEEPVALSPEELDQVVGGLMANRGTTLPEITVKGGGTTTTGILPTNPINKNFGTTSNF